MATISQPEQTAISIDNYAGTLVTGIELRVQSSALNVEYDTDDAISLADDHENYTMGLKDPGDCDMDAVYTRVWAELGIGAWRAPAAKTFTVALSPNGTATGTELNTFETIMTGFEMTCDDKSTATFNRKNKVTGAITKGTNP